MKKLMMIALAACALAMTGCGTLEAEWGGESAITDKDGNPYVVNGVVQKIKHPNKFYSRRFGLDTKIDTGNMSVEKDGYSVSLNGYASSVSPENTKMIDSVAVLTERAIASAMTCGISTITRDSVNAIQAVSSQYIAAGGTLVPTITVTKGDDGKIASLTFSDGRVTQSGSVPIAESAAATATGSECATGTCNSK